MIFKKFGLVVFFLCSSVSLFSQLDKESEKLLKKAERCMKKERYSEAADNVRTVIRKYPVNEYLWSFYQEIYLQNYNTNYFPDLRVSVSSKNGEEDTSLTAFEQSLNKLFVQPKEDYFNAVYDASIYMPFNMKSSGIMRVYHIDPLHFTLDEIDEKSLSKLKEANQQFDAKNYLDAISLAKEAYQLDSNNYSALVKIGLSYFQVGYYGDAAIHFRKAIELEPSLNEARKYLADALNRKGEKQQALEVLKESLMVYPEESTFVKISKLLEQTSRSKYLDRQWILRLAKTNTMTNPHNRQQFFEDHMHFGPYIDHFNDVKAFYSDEGTLLDDTSFPGNKYIEVECWEHMLKVTESEDIPALQYAREMQSKGLLEAYIFISMFNVDLYDQYVHYIANNRSTVERYINNYLISTR